MPAGRVETAEAVCAVLGSQVRLAQKWDLPEKWEIQGQIYCFSQWQTFC